VDGADHQTRLWQTTLHRTSLTWPS
jgi:hypothetical protein